MVVSLRYCWALLFRLRRLQARSSFRYSLVQCIRANIYAECSQKWSDSFGIVVIFRHLLSFFTRISRWKLFCNMSKKWRGIAWIWIYQRILLILYIQKSNNTLLFRAVSCKYQNIFFHCASMEVRLSVYTWRSLTHFMKKWWWNQVKLIRSFIVVCIFNANMSIFVGEFIYCVRMYMAHKYFFT